MKGLAAGQWVAKIAQPAIHWIGVGGGKFDASAGLDARGKRRCRYQGVYS
jgi:hypothetical protein